MVERGSLAQFRAQFPIVKESPTKFVSPLEALLEVYPMRKVSQCVFQILKVFVMPYLLLHITQKPF